MSSKIRILAGLALTFGACAFDGSTESYDFGDPETDTGDPETNIDEPLAAVADPAEPPPTSSIIFTASTEETRRGDLIEGSVLDSHESDGFAEVILAEVSKNSEKLEHDWEFGIVPAGTYELALVALPYGPNVDDLFVVDYKTDMGRTKLLLLASSETMTTYSATIELPEETQIRLRVKLSGGTASMGANPMRQISVDYLALARVD